MELGETILKGFCAIMSLFIVSMVISALGQISNKKQHKSDGTASNNRG